MHRAVAGKTGRRVGIPGSGGLSVNAFLEFFDFVGMALGAFGRSHLSGRGYFVRIAMAGLTGCLAEGGVNAGGHMRTLVRVAGCALNLDHPGGMRIVLDSGVTVPTAESAVNAGRVLDGVNGDAFAAAGCHARLTVAGEATFILFERLWGFGLSLSSSLGGDRCED